jgi:alpha-tubulin suppressor-like RCC1 family protein
MGCSGINQFAYKTGGIAWNWGGNSFGQIGNSTLNSYSSPVAVIGNHSFIHVESGLSHSIGLKQDGSAWCWGDNLYGQCGTSAATNSYSSPVAVVGAHSFVYVASSNRNSFGTKADGTVWAWGNNSSGVLGTNNVTSYSSPVQVVGAHSFLYIKGGGATGGGFAGGLKRDGTLWMWGFNNLGQLGTNNNTSYSSPVQVVGGHSFIDFCCGGFSTYGLKADGTVWSWGYNLYGELGNSSGTQSFSSPVQVVGGHSFISIVASITQVAAGLKVNGSVWTWGYGTGGGIGNNTTTSYSSPVQVVGSHSFCQLRACGGPCLFGLKSNGSIWAWGENNYGRVGDGTITNRSSPVQVVGSHSFLTLQTGDDVNVCISSAWKKKPIIWFKVAGAWKKVGANLLSITQAWKHPARELR